MADEGKVRNVIRDTRKNVKYVILADKKLDRAEKLKYVKQHMYNPLNLRPKKDSTIEINADDFE